jgi:hypothetical protein
MDREMYLSEMEEQRLGGSKKPRSRSASYVPAWRRGLPKTAKKLAQKSGSKKKKAMKVVGTKAQVYHGTALRTKNNLTKADLMRRTAVIKSGKNKGKMTTRIVTRKGHERAKKMDLAAKLRGKQIADQAWEAHQLADARRARAIYSLERRGARLGGATTAMHQLPQYAWTTPRYGGSAMSMPLYY